MALDEYIGKKRLKDILSLIKNEIDPLQKKEITWEAYKELTNSEKNNGTLYMITNIDPNEVKEFLKENKLKR